MIIAGCGGYGFSLAARYRRQERTLSELINALERMECEQPRPGKGYLVTPEGYREIP